MDARIASALCLVATAVCACSSDAGDSHANSLPGSGAQASGGTGASSGNTGDGGSSARAGISGGGGASASGGQNGGASQGNGGSLFETRPFGDGSCIAEVHRGEAIPADLYILFDQSQSMREDAGGVPRIDAVRDAIRDFVHDDESRGIGVGIGYFGHLIPTQCDAAAYSQPDVPIALLPEQADVIMGSLDARVPVHETPTGAAIRGACRYVSGYRQNRPNHYSALLVVTDGIPETPATNACQPSQSVADAVAAARACLDGDSQIFTYVLGVGPNLSSLQQIAQAGGTESAYLVDSDTAVGLEVLDALNAIRTEANVACDYVIPPAPTGEQFDYAQVNVEYALTDAERQVAYNVERPADCPDDEAAWYYDDLENPTKIHLCPSLCTQIEADDQAGLSVALGCETVVQPR